MKAVPFVTAAQLAAIQHAVFRPSLALEPLPAKIKGAA